MMNILAEKWQAIRFFTHLLIISAEDTVEDEVGEKKRPLALDVIEDLQFGWLIVQSGLVLQRRHVAIA